MEDSGRMILRKTSIDVGQILLYPALGNLETRPSLVWFRLANPPGKDRTDPGTHFLPLAPFIVSNFIKVLMIVFPII